MGTKHRDFGTLNGASEGAAGDRTSDIHAPGFIGSTDPATIYGTSDSTKPPGVQARHLWIEESSTDTPTALKYRNNANSAWVNLAPAISYLDDEKLTFGAGDDYWLVYNSTGTQFELWTTDNDGGGSDGLIFDVADGADVLDFTTTPTVGGTNVVLETRTLTAGTGLTGGGDLSANRTFNVSGLTNSEIAAGAEIAVAKLADGSARQLLQTDAAGTGVEWASNIDVPGTLDVTGAATLDSTLTFAETSNDYTVGAADNPLFLQIRGQSANTAVALALVSQTSDAGDDAIFRVYGLGDPGATDTEAVQFGWSSSRSQFEMQTQFTSGGTARDLALFTSGNDGQLTLNANNSLSTTGAASFDTNANGSSFGGELTLDGGVLALAETTTPGATAGEGRIYTKTDNKLYFQDGAGTEHEVAFV